MKMRCLVAALAALASVCGLAEIEECKVTFELKGTPSPEKKTTTVDYGNPCLVEFDVPWGYCITNIVVERSAPKGLGTAYALIIGASEYEGSDYVLDCCETDAEMMAKALKPCASVYSFTGTSATKAAIDGVMTSLSAMLKSGDTFIYYHSSTGGPGSIYTYDGAYTAEDLANDLSAFAEGVKIFVIIDASSSGSFAESLNGKATYMLSSKADQGSYVFPAVGMSAFTASMYYGGRCAWADDDDDGLITAEELANGTMGYMKLIKYKKQTPVIGVKSTDDLKVYLSTMNNPDWFGNLQYRVDGVTCNYYIASMKQDYAVTVYAAPITDAAGSLMQVSKYSASYKLAGSDLEKGLPMKASMAMTLPVDGEVNMPFEIVSPCYLNGYGAGCFLANLAKFNGKGLNYVMADFDWLPCGKLSAKCNYKKNVVTYKASIKDVDNYLYEAYDTSRPAQEGYFMMRLNGQIFTSEWGLDNKYKEGKSFSSKLSKKGIM